MSTSATRRHPERGRVVRRGCEIDQVFGQSWAWQVGLGRVMDEAHVKRTPPLALAVQRESGRRTVPPGEPRRAVVAGTDAGRRGLLMVTFPFGRPPQGPGPGGVVGDVLQRVHDRIRMAGGLAHDLGRGWSPRGLPLPGSSTTVIHPRLRNPYNEIECSDHYAASMARLRRVPRACGFEYHGRRATSALLRG